MGATLDRLTRRTRVMKSEDGQWIEDDEVEALQCFVCEEKFSFFFRRHHCRRCGNVVCHAHSENQMVIPRLDPIALQRVCDKCIKAPNTPAKVSLAGGLDSLSPDDRNYNENKNGNGNDNDRASRMSERDSSSGIGTPERKRSESNVSGASSAAADNSGGNLAMPPSMQDQVHERIGNGGRHNRGSGSRSGSGGIVKLVKFLLRMTLGLAMLMTLLYSFGHLNGSDLSQPPFTYIVKYRSNIMQALQSLVQWSNSLQAHKQFADVLASPAAARLTAYMQHYYAMLQTTQAWAMCLEGTQKLTQAYSESDEKHRSAVGFIVSFIILRFAVGGSARKRAEA